MGKKSKRAGRNKPKRSGMETYLATLDLPIALDAAAPPLNFRQLADYCMRNLRRIDKQGDMRFRVFEVYLKLAITMEDNEFTVWNKNDYKFMRKIAYDEDDLTFIRVQSLYTLAHTNHQSKKDIEGKTDYFEKIKEPCKNASEDQKSHHPPTLLSWVG